MESAAAVPPDLANAIVAGDAAAVARCFHPDVRFRALTPRTERRAGSAAEAAAIFAEWFGDATELTLLESSTTSIAERVRIAWRIAGVEGGVPFTVEQTAYGDVVDGRISDLAIVCSGFRFAMAAADTAAHQFDAGDLGCGSGLPGEVRRQLAGIAIGERLRIVTRDAAAREDLPALARLLGHRVLAVEPGDGATTITLERVR